MNPPRRKRGSTMVARGEPMLWLTGGALAFCLLMIGGLLAWIGAQGASTFWPLAVEKVTTEDGLVLVGEVTRTERLRPEPGAFAALPDAAAVRLREELAQNEGTAQRRLLRTGNFDLAGTHFHWVNDFAVRERDQPDWAVVVERLTWGRFVGEPAAYVRLTALPGPSRDAALRQVDELAQAMAAEPGFELRVLVERRDGDGSGQLLVARRDVGPSDRALALAECWLGRERAWARFGAEHDRVRGLWRQKKSLERNEVGAVHARLEEARVALRQAELDHSPPAPWLAAYQRLAEARGQNDAAEVAAGTERLRLVEQEFGPPPAAFLAAVAAVEAAQASAHADFARIAAVSAELDRALSRDGLWLRTAQGQEKLLLLHEIVRAYPANQLSLGGKIGVYLSRWWEFLTDEPRESNFEGGVFPAIFGTALMSLIMCMLVVPFGVLAALYLREYAKAGPVISTVRIAVNNLAGVPSIVFGVFGVGFFCYMVGSQVDELLFAAHLPQPTFGTGGLLWASLTLALLTAPVVIVATEEALAAVPNSMREGSYACGASKSQTIRRIVLPRALPGIMTGAILAMARGAGEVAPLMLVGAVKLAPELPIAAEPPFGLERSFMHLGFHIYDLGFQSQNSEAAKPMVYTTALLLIALIALLNLTAVALRARLRRRFVAAHF